MRNNNSRMYTNTKQSLVLKNSKNHTFSLQAIFSGIFLVLSLFLQSPAFAASWGWQNKTEALPNSLQGIIASQNSEEEILSFHFDTPQQLSISRIGRNQLAIQLSNPVNSLAAQNNRIPSDKLTNSVSPQSSAIIINTNTPGFSFTAQQDNPVTLTVTLKPDQLGERWIAPRNQAPRTVLRPISSAIPYRPAQTTPTRELVEQPPVRQPVPQQPVQQPAPAPQQIPVPVPMPIVIQQPAPAPQPVAQLVPQPTPQSAPIQQPAVQPAPVQQPVAQPTPTPAPVQQPIAQPAPRPATQPAPAAQQAAPVDDGWTVLETPTGNPAPVQQPTPVQPAPTPAPAPQQPAPVQQPTPQPVPVPVPTPQQPAPVEQPQTPAAQPATTPPAQQPATTPAVRPVNTANLSPTQLAKYNLDRAIGFVEKGDLTTAEIILADIPGNQEATSDVREQALYLLARITFQKHRLSLRQTAGLIQQHANRAVEFNTRSVRTPEARYYLAYTYLNSSNLDKSIVTSKPFVRKKAEDEFNLATQVAPDSPFIPLFVLLLADDDLRYDRFDSAVTYYQEFYSKWPDHPQAQHAARRLVESLAGLGYYEQGIAVFEDMVERWPEILFTDPNIFAIGGDLYNNAVAVYEGYSAPEAQEKTTELRNKAKDYYLRYLNINPEGDEAGHVYTRLGDMYLDLGQRDAAFYAFTQAANHFTNTDEGLIAGMRLAKEFGAPQPPYPTSLTEKNIQSTNPPDIYQLVLKIRRPDHFLVPVAHLELALWYNQRYNPEASLKESTYFIEHYPDNPYFDTAVNTLAAAVDQTAAIGQIQNDTSEMVRIFSDFPLITTYKNKVSPEARLIMANALHSEGAPDKAIEFIDGFFEEAKGPHSEAALSLALGILIEDKNWDKISDIIKRTALWELTPQIQLAFNYAYGLSLEHAKEIDKAIELWETLKDNQDLTSEQQAFVSFFLGNHYNDKHESIFAYKHYLKALQLFQKAGVENNNPDVARIRTCLTELRVLLEGMQKYKAALEFAEAESAYFPATDTSPANIANRQANLIIRAGLHREMQEGIAWRRLLEQAITLDPNSTFGKQAAMTLRLDTVIQSTDNF